MKGEEQAEGMDQKCYKNRSFHHPRAAEVLRPARKRSVGLELRESEAERGGEEKRETERPGISHFGELRR